MKRLPALSCNSSVGSASVPPIVPAMEGPVARRTDPLGLRAANDEPADQNIVIQADPHPRRDIGQAWADGRRRSRRGDGRAIHALRAGDVVVRKRFTVARDRQRAMMLSPSGVVEADGMAEFME